MSQWHLSDLHWTSILDQAAEQLDGGPRSFPLASEAEFMRNYAYDPPTEKYRRLFFRQATVVNSQRDALFCSHSAGWLIPDDASDCKPVFIAHSVLSAIWLLRQTLPNGTLPDDAWDRLVGAAQLLAQDPQEEPPSAQKPRNSTPLPAKRPASSTQTSTPKRVQTEIEPDNQAAPQSQDELSPASPQQSELSQPDEPSQEEPVLITTVTNKNRRADQARSRKLETARLNKKHDLGLIAPNDKAARLEQAAYASISQQDEPVIAWIIKQPVNDDLDFYSTAKSPYTTACSMLGKARAIGNQSAQYYAASFLQIWRTRGTPFPTRTVSSSPLPAGLPSKKDLPWSKQQLSATDDAFRCAWQLVNHYEGELAAVHIEYRWAMAFLGRAYADKIAELKQEDEIAGRGKHKNRGGKGHVRSEAIAALLQLVGSKITAREKKIFKKRLLRASRWYDAANALGWGCLCLMPHDVIANFWVEQTLRVGEWRVWLELVKKVNPEAHAASIALDTWLGSEGIAGGPLVGKEALCIEAEAPATIYEVEEIQDSEDEDEDNFELTESQITSHSTAPAQPLRQRTLLELFKPQ